ncbi:MAG: deoxyribonuclease IV [Candidatus Marsarchaeota archaeon]|nr:deoxyribonuclease IV [Candidatus Marsarchaeota archaeon]MCL5413315.1 deoxyribonuclease IV [Candidatus Marsarchaeota archaeon]
MVLLGRHVSIAGGLKNALDMSVALQCTAMQIFVTNPRAWQLGPLDEQSASEFRSEMKSTGIVTVAHMPYLPNISSSKSNIFAKSVKSLADNISRCSNLGIGYLVVHMGSHMGNGKKIAIGNIVSAVEEALEGKSGTYILLENEAGHRNSVGDTVNDMAEVYDTVGEGRLGFCLDTCHLYAAGYDIADHEELDRIFDEINLDNVHAIHINDAKFGLGSHKDRHANIGYGHIGTEGFGRFLSYKGIRSKILILETPVSTEISESDEIRRIKSLLH